LTAIAGGDEAVAVRHPAQCLPCRICAAGKFTDRPIDDVPDDAAAKPLWHEAQETPEAQMLHRWDSTTIGRWWRRWPNRFARPSCCARFTIYPTGNRRRRGRAGWHRNVGVSPAPAPCCDQLVGRKGATEMTCDEAEILLNALIDGELDAGHARARRRPYRSACPRCAAQPSFAVSR